MSLEESVQNGSSNYILSKDYHEIVMPMIEQAVRTQMLESISSAGMPDHQVPDMVFAVFEATYQTRSEIDSKTSQVLTKSGALVGEGDEKFIAPSSMGIAVFASSYHDKIARKSLEIKPSANGTLKQGQIQIALPKLVRETIDAANKNGRDAEKYLRQQPITTKRHYFFVSQPGDNSTYMAVEKDPNNLQTRNMIVGALSNIKANLETRLSDLDTVTAAFSTNQRFMAVFGMLYDKYEPDKDKKLREVKGITKDSRIALEVYAKLNSGVDARFFEAGAGGIEAIRFTTFDTLDKMNNRIVVTREFDKVTEAISDYVANKIVERDTDENISSLGQSAPVVLGQRAAAYLVYAITMYASGTMMLNQMLKEDKKTLASRIGTAVLPHYMNLIVNGQQHVDNLDDSKRYGSMLIDAEGTLVRPSQIIESGILKTALTTRETLLPVLDDTDLVARTEAGKTKAGRPIYRWNTKDSEPLYGFARRKDYSSDIVAAPTNINLLEDPNGPTSLEDFVLKIGKKDKGLFVESVQSVTIDSDGNITLDMDLGYSIENGTRNQEVRFKTGRVYLKLDELKDTILAISGKETAMRTPMDAQVASGQVMPVSVKSPMIALSRGDFAARSKYGGSEYQGYVSRLSEEGLEPFYDKLRRERTEGVLQPSGPTILTAINGMARVKQDTMPGTIYIVDSDTTIGPTYVLGPRGELKKN